MPLKDIQLCHVDPVNRTAVTIHSDDGAASATFLCEGEVEALRLRDAIRRHASNLKAVFDPGRVRGTDAEFEAAGRIRGAQAAQVQLLIDQLQELKRALRGQP